ncbi:hypothetical protein ACIRPN_32800 [Streptomyces sp. NPDC101230]|uniref:hypothetical protein n=1 Tax=unclassified Streptomyces TaxID=2593676 RepID=UPI0038230919
MPAETGETGEPVAARPEAPAPADAPAGPSGELVAGGTAPRAAESGVPAAVASAGTDRTAAPGAAAPTALGAAAPTALGAAAPTALGAAASAAPASAAPTASASAAPTAPRATTANHPTEPPSRPAEIPARPGRRKPAVAPARRGPADPVKSLMHHHRDLCERAVSPLEIAAGLEAHGLTDRTAARYRHRDVFALAEELYARTPARPAEPPPPVGAAPHSDSEARAGWTLLALLPGAACLATAGLLRVTEGVLGGGARFAVIVTGALLACLALRLCLRRGPLRAPEGAGRAGMYACWLLSFAVYGDGLVAQVVSGGPDGPWGADPAPLLGLTAAVAPAAWCAHLFTVRAHRKLTGSRALEEFGAGVRPLLLAAVVLFVCALLPLLFLAGLGLGSTGLPIAAAALGVLFFLARLLAAHGLPEPGTVALAAACAMEAAAPALLLAGRLPGLEPLARPVHALVAAGGPGAVPALACGAAALGLLLHASAALSRASAHARA